MDKKSPAQQLINPSSNFPINNHFCSVRLFVLLENIKLT